MSEKVYKVWVRVCVEEYDPIKDDHRNVIDCEDGLCEDTDPEEYDSSEFGNYDAAQALADGISTKIPKLFGGHLNDD